MLLKVKLSRYSDNLMRTKNQKYWDRVGILTLIHGVNEISSIDGNLKAQKLPFLIELKGLERGILSLHFKFFRHHYGPFSKELWDDFDYLIQSEFITSSRKLTKKGQFIVEYVSEDMQKSDVGQKARDIIDETIKEFGRKSGHRLKDIVYNLKVPVHYYGNEYKKVKDIDHYVDIFVPAEEPDKVDVPSLSEEVIFIIEEESNLALSHLDPSRPHYKHTIKEATQRVREAISA